MKCFLVIAFLLAAIVAVSCSGYGLSGYGDGGYGGHGARAYVGPNVLFGGYTLASSSVSGPLKKGLYTTSFLGGKGGHY